MFAREWTSYLPEYRFPSYLRNCFGCFAVIIVLSAVVIFLGLPSLFTYINSLDQEPVIDVAVGAALPLEDSYSIEVISVENDTRCPGEATCSPPGSVVVRFRNTLNNLEYVLEYAEGSDFSDVVSLPEGYVVRIVNVFPDSSSPSNSYRVRFQIFNPPSE
ncbi:MAG: hypothetical protein AAFU54_18875 [Chloroflexota bacterium]